MWCHRLSVALVSAIVAQQVGSASALTRADVTAAPTIYPTPQHVSATGGRVLAITPTVGLELGGGVDGAATNVVRAALRAAGASVRSPAAVKPNSVLVAFGRNQLEKELGVASSSGLPAGGYVLASGYANGRPIVVLDGVDPAGDFYAAQTLSQLLAGRKTLPSLTIRDWPSFGRRGVIEGFYGKPWSLASTLDMLDFLGSHKLNTFLYLPKDVALLRNDWRAPLTPAFQKDVVTIVRRARLNHVQVGIGVSPGASICYTSTADQSLLLAKLEDLWRLGARSFAIAFDDIAPGFQCDSDSTRFGDDDASLARAQAFLVNRLDTTLHRDLRGMDPLSMVPTEYSGLATSAYRVQLAGSLRPDVVIEWTGPRTLAGSITSADAATATTGFAHPISVWDNYFVNDYLPGAIDLGPFMNRSPTLFKTVAGISVNPLSEPTAARIELFTFADYSWNPAAYRPQKSWQSSLEELSQHDSLVDGALREVAETNFAPAAGDGQAPRLTAAMATFWRNWNAGDVEAAEPLKKELQQLRDAPSILEHRFTNEAFLSEMKPWLTATSLWAGAAVDALDSMVAYRTGLGAFDADQRQARALREEALALSVPGVTPTASIQIAGGLIASFVHLALRGYGP